MFQYNPQLMSERRVWFAFLLLSLAWGTSFLFIKIAVRTLQPLTLVGFRLTIGLIGLLVVLKAQKLRLPRDWTTWRHLATLGLINGAIPFVLITWAESGEQGLDSGVASVLNSTVPLFSIVISGLFLKVESVTTGKLAGLGIGFLGVILLVSRDLTDEFVGVLPYVAVTVAAICYAGATAYARRYLQSFPAVVLATGQIGTAALFTLTGAFIWEGLAQQSLVALLPLPTLVAILSLGLFGSCLAYILYFFVLKQWGATRTTLVTYLIPVVGVGAGVLVLGEAVDWQLVVGGLLILSGVGAVNLKR